MTSLLFELCAENLEAARAAQAGGADQIELCAGLSGGGITPPMNLVAAAAGAVTIPVSVLIRPRQGDFVFTGDEFELMRGQIAGAKRAGATAVALGVLLPGGGVDVARSRELVAAARPMQVTFHRAFDESADLSAALEDVIAAGADCLLTSGGGSDVLAGAAMIASLRRQARGRIRIMAGGGLRLENLAQVVRRSGVTMLHSSLTRANGARLHANGESAAGNGHVLEADVRQAIRLFHEAFQARTAATAAVRD